VSWRQRPEYAELCFWPQGTAPEGAAVFAHNDRVMSAPADKVWAWLVRAVMWPQWYTNASRVRLDGSGDSLEAGMTFRWVTFGTPLRSEVAEFQPPAHLGWLWWCYGAYGYHGWDLYPLRHGTRVVTEETQRGPRAVLLAQPLHLALLIAHHHWLQRLALACASVADTAGQQIRASSVRERIRR
jgi:hypothetical protein